MRKILLLICILLAGCSKSTIYDTYVKNLKENNNISEKIPFDIEFYIDNVNENRIIYQVIIDNPKIETDNVTALVIHDGETNDIFPSVGIVDDKVDLNIDKGIILLGYVDQTSNINFKVLIETNNNQYVYQYKYWQYF